MKVIQTTGKRKTSVARATLKQGKGIVRVNSVLLDNYNNLFARTRLMEPLIIAGEVSKKVDINVNVNGGGWHSQAEASRLAVAKAMAEFDKKLRKIYLDYDRHLLIADIRRKEQRKPNDSKARKSRQTSYR